MILGLSLDVRMHNQRRIDILRIVIENIQHVKTKIFRGR